MELVVNGDTLGGPVTDELIARSINSLTGDGDSFAVLAKASQVYIQTSGDPQHGFVLEYREGSEDEHYSCMNPDLTADQVIQAMQRYRSGDSRWRTDLQWESLSYEASAPLKGKYLLFGAILLLVVGVALWGTLIR